MCFRSETFAPTGGFEIVRKDGEGVLWYPDIKYYLLGRKIGKEWFKEKGEKQ